LFSEQFVCFWPNSPPVGQGPLIKEVSRPHTTTHHSRYDFSGQMISPSQRPLPDNTQHSQQTDIHAPGGIRIRLHSRRAASNLRLRPRGHWVQPFSEEYNSDIVYPVDNSSILVTGFRSPVVSRPHTTDTGLHPFDHSHKMHPPKIYKTHNETK
jgi:hypothetical protein